MTALSAAKAILEADTTLLATATGGVWDFDETGRQGLSRTITTGAFDSNGIIKPCVLLKLRSSTPDLVLRDDANQYNSVREIVEVWFYQDTGYDKIETMRNRVYRDLHAQRLSGMWQLLWGGDIRPGIRDTDLDASVERSDYLAIVKKSV